MRRVKTAAAILSLFILATCLAAIPASAEDYRYVLPAQLNFDAVAVDDGAQLMYFTIWNNTSGAFDITLPERLGDFHFTEPGTHTLAGNQRFSATFRPTTVGHHSVTLDLDIPEETHGDRLTLDGLGLGGEPSALVDAASLDFGHVLVGESRGEMVRITNTSTSTLSGFMQTDCPEIAPASGEYFWHIFPGETLPLSLTFTPAAPGAVACSLDLGVDYIEPFALSGTGFEDAAQQDLIGVWFEQTGQINSYTTTEPYEQVTAYLMIQRPSVPAGVYGWECCVEIQGAATGDNFTLAGEAINIAAAPCFSVGIGGYPLPGQDMIELARIEFLQPSPDEATYFYVHPVDNPSLPGVPSYVDAVDLGHLVPLNWSSGEESRPVAQVNAGGQTPALLSFFRAERRAGAVALEWEILADGPARGVHLWRENGGDDPGLRLTDRPLGDGDETSWLDSPAPTDRAGYRLQLVEDDGSTFWLGRTAVGPAAPRPVTDVLLPNVPNPFNPSTEIRFDLHEAGFVTLAVYSLDGRRIRTLVAGRRPAGEQHAVWYGRDDSGRAVASGTYCYRLETAGTTEARLMTLLK